MKSNASLKVHAEPLSTETDDKLASLRELVLAPVNSRVQELEQQVDSQSEDLNNPELQAQKCSDVLVQAIGISAEKDESLSNALQPEVMKGFHQSIQEDPSELAECLYPVLGPAVRKMVFNMFSPKKANPNKPYTIEQVFIIHKETSLPLNHTVIDEAMVQDADMVSGMLDAIRSFVRDAFSQHDFDGLNTLQVGDLSVWVEWGPKAILAVVMHGQVPDDLRDVFARLLEQFHIEHRETLLDYDGDDSAFESFTPIIEETIDAVKPADKLALSRSPLSKIILGCTAVCVLLLLGQWSHNERKWNTVIDTIKAEPGITLLSSDRSFNHFEFNALRDPLAKDSEALLANLPIARNQIQDHWIEAPSFDDEIIVKKLVLALTPPNSISISASNKQVLITGKAPLAWHQQTKPLLPILSSILGTVISITAQPL